MDQKPELTAKVIAALDACRHDSDDHDLPEVASVLTDVPQERAAEYRRAIERIDRAVGGAMQEIPVPSGLAERILAGVQAHSSTAGAVCDQDQICGHELLARPIETGEKLVRPSGDPVVVGEAGKGVARRPSRRLVLAGTLLTMAAGFLIAVVLQLTRESLDAGDLLAQAKLFYATDDHSAPFSDKEPPFSAPVGSVIGWRPVTFLSRAGAAFELSGGAGRRRVAGTLYVIPVSSFRGPVFSGLPAGPLPRGTSGMTVAVWTVGKDVYVMIVKGDEATFRSFFVQKFA
jgi:hypothetical protein